MDVPTYRRILLLHIWARYVQYRPPPQPVYQALRGQPGCTKPAGYVQYHMICPSGGILRLLDATGDDGRLFDFPPGLDTGGCPPGLSEGRSPTGRPGPSVNYRRSETGGGLWCRSWRVWWVRSSNVVPGARL